MIKLKMSKLVALHLHMLDHKNSKCVFTLLVYMGNIFAFLPFFRKLILRKEEFSELSIFSKMCRQKFLLEALIASKDRRLSLK